MRISQLMEELGQIQGVVGDVEVLFRAPSMCNPSEQEVYDIDEVECNFLVTGPRLGESWYRVILS